MASLWPFIPCLLTYPLLGACAKMTEVIYAKCTASGCQCQNNYVSKQTADAKAAAEAATAAQQRSSADAKHVKELAANVNNPSLNKIIDAPPEKRLLITTPSKNNDPGLGTNFAVHGSNSKLLLQKPKLALQQS